MTGSLINREVLPFVLALAALAAAALLLDLVLHLADLVWIGRYLGIPGTVLILLSLRYSLRKRKLITTGDPVSLLRRHEWMAWAGSLLVLVHAGIHFNGWLAWLAVIAMLVNVASGLTGRFLMQRTQRWLKEARTDLSEHGVAQEQVAAQLCWESRTVDLVRQWRKVHVPITMTFGVLALAHIIAVFLFWGWR